ncbi:hypothetical protein KO529_01450 [Arenibacter algicola]|uniref:hypothetical protein n=1 Tax=Arenibacter algicola TaxID=616991 RepID=UPI001C07087D|nr:hypothetical protein [Arenibacter algicola]MBU2903434.1 hypothetical protein [Arenibacter algicola]
MKKIVLPIIVLCVFSCHKYSPEIRQALDMAEGNKVELIQVLEHYEKKGDSLKMAAAEFLISNLPYNYSYDTTYLKKFRDIPNIAESQLEQNGVIDSDRLNKLWDNLKTRYSPSASVYSRPVLEDIKFVTGEFLIKNIDEAFDSWQRNPYAHDSVPFEHFCEYVLPYRLIQGKAIEDWRGFFKRENKYHLENSYPIPFTKACDSLFGQYKEYVFNYELTEGLPILKFKDFMKMKSGKCTVKSWFNTYIVNTEGVPMVADFVPAWGHREDDHQWNALLYGGKTLYFESYWEKDHSWFYNDTINSNRFDDDWSGNVRLPKIYRHTFSTHLTGPLSDKRVKMENIPLLFKNVKQKDVSDEYFNAVDVSVDIAGKIPENTYYAYLSVLGVNKQWVPVQWGRIEDGPLIFKKMGTDIVYQTVLYKNGTVIPFGNPFHLDHNGEMTKFIPDENTHEITITRKYWAKNGLEKDAKLIKGALVQAANREDFKDAVTLLKIDFDPELRPYEIPLNLDKEYRYFRIFSKNSITIKEIDLFGDDGSGKKETQLKGSFIMNSSSTKNNPSTWKGIDLGIKQNVSKIRFAPPNNLNHVLKGLNYELFYVDKGVFVSLGKQKAEGYELKYKNVPKNALLYLKCLDEGRQERIFEYRNGEQIWY